MSWTLSDGFLMVLQDMKRKKVQTKSDLQAQIAWWINGGQFKN